MDETKKEFTRIWDGLLYHCSELSCFMAKHGDDEFFDSDIGKDMKKHALTLMTTHLFGMMKLKGDDIFNLSNNPKKAAFDFEDILKKGFEP